MALAANALTLLATVKTDLGITVSTFDARLERAINAASDRIERYCGRTFYRDEEIEETVAPMYWPKILLARAPINAIESVVYDGSTLSSDDYEIHDANVGSVFMSGGWGWSAQLADDASRSVLPGTEQRNVVVTYDGGWFTPAQEAADALDVRTLPYDIEEACIELVRFMYLGKGRDPNVKSESIGEWSAAYGSDGSSEKYGMPSAVADALRPYRRIV